jgi:DNA-binding protein H-NS
VAVIEAAITVQVKRLTASAPETRRSPYQSGGSPLLGTTDINMKPRDLKLMSVDELWALREEIAAALTRRIFTEKRQLEQRLQKLLPSDLPNKNRLHVRRPYPQVLPKYRNPAKPAETWAGRGKQPRWLTAQLKSGKKLDDFRIQPSSGRARRSRSRS